MGKIDPEDLPANLTARLRKGEQRDKAGQREGRNNQTIALRKEYARLFDLSPRELIHQNISDEALMEAIHAHQEEAPAQMDQPKDHYSNKGGHLARGQHYKGRQTSRARIDNTGDPTNFGLDPALDEMALSPVELEKRIHSTDSAKADTKTSFTDRIQQTGTGRGR